MTGNTSMVFTGMRLQPLSDVRCRFGDLNVEVNATVEDSHTLRAVSPYHWNSGRQRWNLRAASQQVVQHRIPLPFRFIPSHPISSHLIRSYPISSHLSHHI